MAQPVGGVAVVLALFWLLFDYHMLLVFMFSPACKKSWEGAGLPA